MTYQRVGDVEVGTFYSGEVYLAGPITGETWEGATDWREFAADLLAEHGVGSLSPLRGKEYLAAFGVLEDQYIDMHPLSTAAGIVTRDRNDTMVRADAVIMNVHGADRVSIGTMIEAGWADAARTPVILVIEDEGNVHDHSMLTQIAGFRTDNLADAVLIAATIVGA